RLTEIDPGEMYVIAGDEPRLKVRVGGVRPDTVHAVWDGVSFADRRILLAEKERGHWEGGFPPVLEDGSYHVAAGDTRSDLFGITVLPRPAVVQVRLTLSPPAYTGLPARTVDDGNAVMVSGTMVGLRAQTNLPPQIGHLQFDSGRRIWLAPVEGESVLTGRFPVLRSDAYSVHFESIRYPDGASFENLSPVKFRITCREDAAPVVKLLAPPDGLEARPSETVKVTYTAHDDFRVARVRLRYSVNGLVGPDVTIAEPRVRRLEEAAHRWELSAISLRPGTVLTYYLEAEDNRPNVPQVGRSETRRIVIVGPRPEPEKGPTPPAERAEAGEGAPRERQRPREEARRGESAQEAGPREVTSPEAPPRGAPPREVTSREAPPREAPPREGSPEDGQAERERQGSLEEHARRIAKLLGRQGRSRGDAAEAPPQP
ncbi:MAG: hypothetical protein KAX19_08075, partial [Candidatus Brocadiae bacterium]|nr:hypothetical protein [Candidatus Brocadiia bacterium]